MYSLGVRRDFGLASAKSLNKGYVRFLDEIFLTISSIATFIISPFYYGDIMDPWLLVVVVSMVFFMFWGGVGVSYSNIIKTIPFLEWDKNERIQKYKFLKAYFKNNGLFNIAMSLSFAFIIIDIVIIEKKDDINYYFFFIHIFSFIIYLFNYFNTVSIWNKYFDKYLVIKKPIQKKPENWKFNLDNLYEGSEYLEKELYEQILLEKLIEVD